MMKSSNKMKLDEALGILKKSNIKVNKPGDGHPMDFAWLKFEAKYANDLSDPAKIWEFDQGFYGMNSPHSEEGAGINAEAVWHERPFEYNGESCTAKLKNNLIRFRYTKGIMLFQVLVKTEKEHDTDEWCEIARAFNESAAFDDILKSLMEETPIKIVETTLKKSDFWR